MFPVPRHVILDIETTGLSPRRGHRIIEIGAIAVENGHPAEEFCSLVKIDRKIPPEVQRIHGITDEMLANEPGAEEVIPRLYNFLGDGVIVAHNARFDLGFLRHEFARLSLPLRYRSLCTLEMSRRLYPRLPDYKRYSLPPPLRRDRGEHPAAPGTRRRLDGGADMDGDATNI